MLKIGFQLKVLEARRLYQDWKTIFFLSLRTSMKKTLTRQHELWLNLGDNYDGKNCKN